MIRHDLRCEGCDAIERDVWVESGLFPPCPECGGARTWVPAGFATDVYGQPYFNEALKVDVTSSRQIHKLAKERRWEAHEHQLAKNGRLPKLYPSAAGRRQMAAIHAADARAARAKR